LSRHAAVAVALATSAAATTLAAPFDVLDVEQHGVGGADALEGARAIAPSPDGAHVYVCATGSGSVAAFAVDATSGALTPRGAVVNEIGGAFGLGLCVDVAISPDGKHVYAAGFGNDAIAILARDAATGALSYVGAVTNEDLLPTGGLDGASGVIVSPDGLHVYATAGLSDAVVAFARDADTGALTFVETVAGDPNLDGAVDLAASPSGAFVYVISQGPQGDALLTYQRDETTGALALFDTEEQTPGVVEGLGAPNSLAVSPDGRFVYVVSGLTGVPTPVASQLSIFERSAADDTLSQVTLYEDDVGGVDGISYPFGIALSADGAWVFVTGASDDAVAVFARDPESGLLTFERAIRDDADPSLRLDFAIEPAADPLGRFFYVAAFNASTVTVFAPEPGSTACAALACGALAAARRRARARWRISRGS
jgi:6-phosphogluconolactonase (cycloisomerase 2 family)